MSEQEILEFLKRNGYPEHVCRAGGQGLVLRWNRFVDEVERGYELGLEEYRTELDIRALIARLGLEGQVRTADERFHKLLIERGQCVWQTEPAGFWTFGFPANAKGELLADLQLEGLLTIEPE